MVYDYTKRLAYEKQPKRDHNKDCRCFDENHWRLPERKAQMSK